MNHPSSLAIDLAVTVDDCSGIITVTDGGTA